MMTRILLSLAIILFALPLLSFAQENQPSAGGYCPHITQNLKRGDRDANTQGQVTELQKFLADYYDLDPATYVTGYFGRLTQQNVIRFQREQNLPAYGYVGPLTRTAIARVCGGGGNVSANFTAAPTSGRAPLEVRFTFPSSGADMYSIDFGDGQIGGPLVGASCDPDSGACLPTRSAYHTYTAPGIYTARLFKLDIRQCPSCGGEITVGTVTIIVHGTSIPPTTISCGPRDAFVPVCGHVPGFCPSGGNGIQLGAPCSAPRDGTFLNMCELQDAQATLLHSGTCTGQALQPLLVLSPHGGETFAPGNPITISWQSPRPDSGTTHINLSLGSPLQNTGSTCTTTTNGNTSTTCSATAGSIQLIPGIITGTSYTWTIPQSYTNAPGQYRISVGWSDTDINMSAYSGVFTISGH